MWTGQHQYCHGEEDYRMKSRALRRSLLVGMCLGLFVVGFLCGSVSQRSADAQLPGVGKGALGSVTELGSSIVEMQQHVNGLQKNLDTLKKIQGVLGGGR
jgi:hypothetical protein